MNMSRIREYFVKEVGVPEEEVAAIQAHYHETYGLSLRGLTKHHSVDPLDFDLKKLGWTTVHVADDASKSNHGDYQIEDIHELPQVLPELWEPRHHEMKLKKQPVGVTASAV
ncbi:Putative Pyrimidine 5'-nucleotidase [Rhizopus microsporus]|nr:Putative Pyrimidine 5'-nucleotidase [Rhizopus microsporus]